MKKRFSILVLGLGAILSTKAQTYEVKEVIVEEEIQIDDALTKGTWLVEANTNFGRAHAANTSFSLNTSDDYTSWGVGFEGGYFIADDFAIKAGMGYSDDDISDGTFSYKLGAKYYILSQFPVQADFNGSTGNDISPLFLGLQGGYAWFIANNIALEPGVRYDFDLNNDADRLNGFSLNIGFSLFFSLDWTGGACCIQCTPYIIKPKLP